MTTRRAMAISAVFSAIDLYVRTISTLPLEVFAERGDGREKVASGRTVEVERLTVAGLAQHPGDEVQLLAGWRRTEGGEAAAQ
jgi:hypothetical protein